MGKLSDQWNKYNYKDLDRQRIYLKDIDCPNMWFDKLKEKVPPNILYLNESTGDIGGPGAVSPYEPGIARAGDLMSCLPPAMRAENLMCYIGHEGTYTPAHREMCASLGQNLMVEAAKGVFEDGKVTKRGSSIWFMTESRDRHMVSEYWLSALGHDIEIESHFAQVNAWKRAPFTTYIAEQKVGDFILIPPLAPHQVWNRGTRTMKVAWNRTTVETLELALDEALPRARMVCRDEQYKNKAIVMYTLGKYNALFREVERQKQVATPQVRTELQYSPKIKQLQKDFRRLFALYTRILLSESFQPQSTHVKDTQFIPYDSNITCSYCRCNIFNRFLTCPTCLVPLEGGEEDTYDICMDCYAMGRSCRCNSGYKWVEQFTWQDLITKYEIWRHAIIDFGSNVNEKLPPPETFQSELNKYGKKTLAQVCNEQLKERPWLDPTKEVPLAPKSASRVVPDEDQVNDDGTLKTKAKKRKSENNLKEFPYCHVCRYPEAKWKMALCKCGLAYCYGSMYRAFEEMPLSILENPDWSCPHCRKICSCAKCRKNPEQKPKEPNGTVLGYDCKKVADPRSWESLVNYSHGNINWVIKAGDNHPDHTRRMQRRRDAAEAEKSRDPTLDENDYVDKDAVGDREHTNVTNIPIDPSLVHASAMGQNEVEQAILNLGAAMRSTHEDGANNGHPVPSKDNEGDLERELVLVDGITYEYPDPSQPNPSDVANIPPSPPKPEDTHQESLAEAKRKDRYTIAEAKISKRSLVVRLPINRSLLQRLANNMQIEPSQPKSKPDRTIVQSDLQKLASETLKRVGPGKRKHQESDDEVFMPKKAKTAKPSSTKKKPRGRPVQDIESDVEDEFQGVPVPVSKKQNNRRSLPTYLAKRNEEDGMGESEEELPPDFNSSSRRKIPNESHTSNGVRPAPSEPMTNGHANTNKYSDSRNPIDEFPGRLVPNAKPGTDISRLAPGDVNDQLTARAKQAEKNRQAKLHAASANGNMSDASSSADDEEEIEDTTAISMPQRNTNKTPKAPLRSALKQAPISIFDRAKGKKVIISSAAATSKKTLSNGAKPPRKSI